MHPLAKEYPLVRVVLQIPLNQTRKLFLHQPRQLNAKDKGIELVQEIPTDLPAVLGNYDLLLQVFINLVGNALKFTQQGGKVVMRAYLLPKQAVNEYSHNFVERVRIEVSDTGIGIDAEDQQAIFDRFFRVENRHVRTQELKSLLVKNSSHQK